MERTLLAPGTESVHHNTALEAEEPWSAGEDPPLGMAKDLLGHVTGNAASQGCRCSCCLELLGCREYRTRPAVTRQDTAPCRTASPAQPCSVGAHFLQRTALQLSLLPVCPGLFSESFGEHGVFSTATFTLPGAARHGPSSSSAPGSPGEHLADCSPTNKVTGPPPAALHPLPWLMGQTWKNHRAAECWVGQGLCGLRLTWAIKALLCRSALAGVWTGWAGNRQVGLVCQCSSWW